MLKLALRNVFRHKLRTALTLAAIVFGVVGLVLSGGFVRDVQIQLGEALIHSQSGHLQIALEGYFTYGSRSPEKYAIENPAAVRGKIAGRAGIEDVLTRVHFSGLLNNGRTDWPIVGEGVEPSKEAKLGSFIRIVAGRQLADDDAYGTLIGQGVAKALNLSPGDRVTLLLSTAEGALNNLDLEVVGVFQSFSQEFDDRAVRIPLGAAQEVLGSTRANTLVVSLKSTDDTDAIAERIAELVHGRHLEVKNWRELNDFYEKTVELYRRQFGFLQFVVLIMVVLSVANSVNMSVFERVGEFGTMMSLGDRSNKVFRLIVAENMLLGLIGATLGLLAGAGFAVFLSAIGIPMPPPPNANVGYTARIQLVPSAFATAFAVGFAATIVAALWPALRVSRTPIVTALRSNV
jgi:putative ABC transport system permease protein